MMYKRQASELPIKSEKDAVEITGIFTLKSDQKFWDWQS